MLKLFVLAYLADKGIKKSMWYSGAGSTSPECNAINQSCSLGETGSDTVSRLPRPIPDS